MPIAAHDFESFSACFSNLLNDHFVSSFLALRLTGHVENITPVLKSLFLEMLCFIYLLKFKR